jgi:hypothetical protein
VQKRLDKVFGDGSTVFLHALDEGLKGLDQPLTYFFTGPAPWYK